MLNLELCFILFTGVVQSCALQTISSEEFFLICHIANVFEKYSKSELQEK